MRVKVLCARHGVSPYPPVGVLLRLDFDGLRTMALPPTKATADLSIFHREFGGQFTWRGRGHQVALP